jgi:FMN-dependent NADH-azoreductase
MPSNILKIDSSNRYKQSVSRTLTDHLTKQLLAAFPDAQLIERDLGRGIPQLTEELVEAIRTPLEYHTPELTALLTFSDELVSELEAADIWVFGVPIYNFGVPSVLKAYIDLVVRAGINFKFTEHGAVGLVENKRAYIVVTSGATELDSDVDYAGRYMRVILNFIGVTDVHFISAGMLALDEANCIAGAYQQIDQLFAGV